MPNASSGRLLDPKHAPGFADGHSGLDSPGEHIFGSGIVASLSLSHSATGVLGVGSGDHGGDDAGSSGFSLSGCLYQR